MWRGLGGEGPHGVMGTSTCLHHEYEVARKTVAVREGFLEVELVVLLR